MGPFGIRLQSEHSTESSSTSGRVEVSPGAWQPAPC